MGWIDEEDKWQPFGSSPVKDAYWVILTPEQANCDHDWHEEEMRGLDQSKFFCAKCNLEK